MKGIPMTRALVAFALFFSIFADAQDRGDGYPEGHVTIEESERREANRIERREAEAEARRREAAAREPVPSGNNIRVLRVGAEVRMAEPVVFTPEERTICGQSGHTCWFAMTPFPPGEHCGPAYECCLRDEGSRLVPGASSRTTTYSSSASPLRIEEMPTSMQSDSALAMYIATPRGNRFMLQCRALHPDQTSLANMTIADMNGAFSSMTPPRRYVFSFRQVPAEGERRSGSSSGSGGESSGSSSGESGTSASDEPLDM